MNQKDIIIRKIANTLFINVQHIESNGLLCGKLGVALFFYHYSRYIGVERYTEFPDNLLDLIYDDISQKSPKDFCSGLSGIGWAIEDFVNNHFVEIDADTDILSDMDNFIEGITTEESLKEIELPVPLFSKGLYFIKRNKTSHIKNALEHLINVIEQNSIELRLGYINSVLYFLLWCVEKNIEREICINLLKEMNFHMKQAIDNGLYEIGDLPYTYDHLLQISGINEISDIYKPFTIICKKYISFEVKDRINYLYQTTPNQDCDLQKVDDFIQDNILQLDIEKLTVLKGLAGIGIALLTNKH